ncbi:MAG: cytochrome c [Actinomycetota bacterium]
MATSGPERLTRWWWALVIGLTLVAATAACADSAPAAPADNPQLVLGQDVYARNCASCHRADGSGGVGLKLNEGRVVERYPDVAEQRALIVEGVRAMPGFGDRLDDTELDAVVAYTREVLAPSP